jgi:hypothetical protein
VPAADVTILVSIRRPGGVACEERQMSIDLPEHWTLRSGTKQEIDLGDMTGLVGLTTTLFEQARGFGVQLDVMAFLADTTKLSTAMQLQWVKNQLQKAYKYAQFFEAAGASRSDTDRSSVFYLNALVGGAAGAADTIWIANCFDVSHYRLTVNSTSRLTENDKNEAFNTLLADRAAVAFGNEATKDALRGVASKLSDADRRELISLAGDTRAMSTCTVPAGHCIACGARLGFLDRLLNRSRHKGCAV